MITASVVLFNTPKSDIQKLVESYSPSCDRRLIVIDNASDNSDELMPLLSGEFTEYIRNDRNLGYGGGHNIGLQRAKELGAVYHAVLNPDLSFAPETIDELAGYADEHPEVVYILPKVVNEKGEVQPLCKLLPTPFDLIFRRFFPQKGVFLRRNERYTLAAFGYDRIIDPPCLSGCFMFLRTSCLKEYDIEFDSRFFMYCEDFDLIRRLHRIGKTVYYPFATVVHTHRRASYEETGMLLTHIRSACKYFNKYGWFFDAERSKMNTAVLKELGLYDRRN